MIPPKLKIGHHLRIISTPQKGEIAEEITAKAVNALEGIGLNISFSNLTKAGHTYIDEINEAIIDPDIHGLLLASGIDDDSYFERLDRNAIIANPKIIAGLAEASLLSIYLYHMTDMVNYYGPNLNMLGLSKTIDHCVAAMREILMINATIRVYPSTHYGTGRYQTRKNEIWVVNEGMAEGQCMIGGNCMEDFSTDSLNSSLDYRDNIIFISGNQLHNIAELQNNLELVLDKKGGKYICGLIIGGIEEENISFRQVNELIIDKLELSRIPVLANVNLIKSAPKFTLPIGGSMRMKIKKRNVKIDFTEH